MQARNGRQSLHRPSPLSLRESRPNVFCMMIRIFLAAMAASFAGFGLWSLLEPLGPRGVYERRGVYGVVSLGAACLMAAGAARQSFLRPALWFLVAYLGGYVFARGAGLLLGPAPTPDFYLFIGFETLGLILALVSRRASAGRWMQKAPSRTTGLSTYI